MRLPERYNEVVGDPLIGGMGAVAPCMDKVLERKVAIKTLRVETQRRRLLDELKALQKLRSKHVVQIYDVVQLAPDVLAIIQEFIEGNDLDVKNQPVTNEHDYYRQLWQIASGIADIHEAGVIHRDIKPNNIKRDHEGVIKIFDFGLARDEGSSAKTVGFVGTHGFAAPELYQLPARFTQAVDTYAFGACALYFATGSLPTELRAMPPIPVQKSCFAAQLFKIAPNLIDMLNCCLAVDPNERPAMTDVRNQLARHLLVDRHRALVVHANKPSYLDKDNRSVDLRVQNIGQIAIHYDGLDFKVQSISGEIFINNQQLQAGTSLPGSCVIAFGAAHRGSNRRYLTFDVSHPEVVL